MQDTFNQQLSMILLDNQWGRNMAISLGLFHLRADWKKSRTPRPPMHFIFFFANPPYIANTPYVFYFSRKRPPTHFYFLFRVRSPENLKSNSPYLILPQGWFLNSVQQCALFHDLDFSIEIHGILRIGNLSLRRFCVVSFCEFCVGFTQTMVFVYLGDVHNTISPHKARMW